MGILGPDHDGGGELWTASFRHPTLLVGLLEDDEPLVGKIRARVEAMAKAETRALKALRKYADDPNVDGPAGDID